ncbi:TPA: hypothetical protein ACXND4_005875, partial [Burkholderia multivorans]
RARPIDRRARIRVGPGALSRATDSGIAATRFHFSGSRCDARESRAAFSSSPSISLRSSTGACVCRLPGVDCDRPLRRRRARNRMCRRGCRDAPLASGEQWEIECNPSQHLIGRSKTTSLSSVLPAYRIERSGPRAAA